MPRNSRGFGAIKSINTKLDEFYDILNAPDTQKMARQTLWKIRSHPLDLISQFFVRFPYRDASDCDATNILFYDKFCRFNPQILEYSALNNPIEKLVFSPPAGGLSFYTPQKPLVSAFGRFPGVFFSSAVNHPRVRIISSPKIRTSSPPEFFKIKLRVSSREFNSFTI